MNGKRQPRTALSIWLCFAGIVILMVALSGGAYAESLGEEKNILILNSYTPENTWTQGEERGFLSELDATRKDVVCYHEYMDTKKFSDAAYYKAFANMLKVKYSKIKVDCILTTDDDATLFMNQYRMSIFGSEIPVIYCGVNSKIKMPPAVWGIQEKTSIVELIQLIRKIHGTNKPIVLFTDYSSSSSSTLSDLIERTDSLFRKNITIIRENRVAVGQSKLMGLKDAVVIFLLFNRDDKGNSYSYLEGYELFREYLKLPTYSTWDFYLGSGIVGGIFTSSNEQGRNAAELVLTLFESKESARAEVMAERTKRLNLLDNQAAFDYPQLLAWKIDKDVLPQKSVIINEPVSYFEKNKTLILISLSVIAALVGVILYMTRIIQLKNKFQSELSSSHMELENINTHLEVLVDEKVRELEHSYKKLSDAEMKLLQKEKVESMLNLSLQTAHDLNTPIGNGITLVSYIKEEASKMEQQLQLVSVESTTSLSLEPLYEFFATLNESVAMVEKSLNRAATYIKGIKDRVSSAGELSEIHSESYSSLEEILNHLWPRLVPEMSIERHFEGPPVCLSDRESHVVQTVLKALISNSIQHGFAGPLVDRNPEIRVRWSLEGDCFTLIYDDNGCGIALERQRHLFTPLYKNDLSKGNSSLSLYSALARVESELNGQLACESELDRRTRFTVTFKRE